MRYNTEKGTRGGNNTGAAGEKEGLVPESSLNVVPLCVRVCI